MEFAVEWISETGMNFTNGIMVPYWGFDFDWMLETIFRFDQAFMELAIDWISEIGVAFTKRDGVRYLSGAPSHRQLQGDSQVSQDCRGARH